MLLEKYDSSCLKQKSALVSPHLKLKFRCVHPVICSITHINEVLLFWDSKRKVVATVCPVVTEARA